MILTLLLIWSVFTVLFLILGIYHLKQSKHSMPPLKVKQRPFQQPDSPIKVEIDVCGSPLDQPLQNFVDDFNKYLDSQNKSNSRANQLSACGYFLAALTAFISAIVEIASLRSQ